MGVAGIAVFVTVGRLVVDVGRLVGDTVNVAVGCCTVFTTIPLDTWIGMDVGVPQD
jgi:hypothetical protein